MIEAIIYRDLPDEPDNGYNIAKVPSNDQAKILMQEPITYLQGDTTVYATYLTDGELLIIALTTYDPPKSDRKSIIEGAIAFYNKHN